MLARERQLTILKRVLETGSVRVSELARNLSVTEETIRRDLEKLDGEGKLIRIHGGALALDDDSRELPYDVRKTANLPAKRAIARAAVRYVSEGDVLAIDASSTAAELARVLPDVPLTVITNSIVVATLLSHRRRMRLITTGGVLDSPSLSFVGPLAEESLQRFHFNKVFLSSKGVDVVRGLSVAADDHARMKRRMIELADATYLLADHTKFGVKSVVFFADLSNIDVVVTDAAVEPGYVEGVEKLGIQLERVT
jgi:DeoR/GlpR family transcriptional regulator of sugar metabolism